VKQGKVVLVLGGARSGKSAFAQGIAEALPGSLTYVATGQAFDDEMTVRIARHQADRGSRWQTVECPVELPMVVAEHPADDAVLLVDCLTLWLTNLMLAERDIPTSTNALVAALAGAESTVILVSNEVGQGIVPDNALARQFRDEAGWLHQAVARVADEVWFVTAGLPQRLK
jgi:adenosylcobinamide kinase / adenosylcobinamide-phosphate guanylyltransferase